MKVLFRAFCLSSARTNPTAGFCRKLLYPELWCGTSVKQLVVLVILPQIPSFCTVIILALWMQNNALSFRGLAASFELCEAEILCFVAEKMKMKWRLAQRHSWGGTSGEWGTRSGLMAAGMEAICWSRTVLPAGHCVTWPYAPCAVRTGLSEQRVWVNMERGRGEYQVQARVKKDMWRQEKIRHLRVTWRCRAGGAMAWCCRSSLSRTSSSGTRLRSDVHGVAWGLWAMPKLPSVPPSRAGSAGVGHWGLCERRPWASGSEIHGSPLPWFPKPGLGWLLIVTKRCLLGKNLTRFSFRARKWAGNGRCQIPWAKPCFRAEVVNNCLRPIFVRRLSKAFNYFLSKERQICKSSHSSNVLILNAKVTAH